MAIKRYFYLIPRNNWDYDLASMFRAMGAIRVRGESAPNIERHLGLPPVLTTSGRASLYALLKALDLPAGAAVGVPLFCCPVVFEAIRQAGCIPRFLDSSPDDFNLAPNDLLKKRDGLAAVIAVHMFGNPCDIDPIIAVANGLPVLEDCAQSLFSRYKNKPTGLLADAAFFSFRCGKYLSSGEGSAIICRDPRLRTRVSEIVDTWAPWTKRAMVAHCASTYIKATLYHRPWYGLLGYPIGMRLDSKLNLTAKEGFVTRRIAPSDLSVAERRITEFPVQIDRQRHNAGILRESLARTKLVLPSENRDCASNWFQFALRFDDTGGRDAMAEHLLEQGIDTAKYLDSIGDLARSRYGYLGDCPVAERLSKTTLLIPIHYSLAERDMRRIADSIESCPIP